MEPVLPEVSDPQMLVPLFLCWALMFGLCPHAFCRTTQGLLIYVWSPRCSLRSAVLQFAGKCTTMKSMKAMNPMKAVKAMPTSTGDADCGSGGAKYEAPAWAVAPFYEGGTFANCAQLEGRCWVMSEAIPLSITVGELLETMTSPGCGKGFWYEPIGLAMAVRAHRSQGDDKGSDDDKKKDDDSPKDDGKKKDDDPERAGGEQYPLHDTGCARMMARTMPWTMTVRKMTTRRRTIMTGRKMTTASTMTSRRHTLRLFTSLGICTTPAPAVLSRLGRAA